MTNTEEITIVGNYITLGQFLKLTNFFESGGFIKKYVQNEGVLVNGEKEYRRGRKLYHDDHVQIDEKHRFSLRAEK